MDISGINTGFMDYVTNTAKTSSADKMKQSLDADYSDADDEKLMDVCKQFEAYFIEQVFKEVKKTIPDISGATGANKNLIEFYTDSMIQEAAEQSAEQNSLGLAQMLYEQMKRNIGGETTK